MRSFLLYIEIFYMGGCVILYKFFLSFLNVLQRWTGSTRPKTNKQTNNNKNNNKTKTHTKQTGKQTKEQTKKNKITKHSNKNKLIKLTRDRLCRLDLILDFTLKCNRSAEAKTNSQMKHRRVDKWTNI